MTSAPAKLAGFAVALAIVFGAALLVGGALDADAPAGTKPAASHAASEPAAKAEVGGAGHADAAEAAGTADDEGAHGGGGERHGGAEAAGTTQRVRGLSVADDGMRLVLADDSFRPGARGSLRFRIVDERGRAVRDFDVEHTKRMHVIVVRRDTTGFQHLHPRLGADGSWTTALRFEQPGPYRVFADFVRNGKPHTLASDLRVEGAAELVPLPEPAPAAVTADGYRVELGARPSAGEEATLPFRISRTGRAVQVERYLGAGGHLVALREGDLAFLHVHPTGAGVSFDATFPTAGRYRLFLQFKHQGEVRTAAFTQEVS